MFENMEEELQTPALTLPSAFINFPLRGVWFPWEPLPKRQVVMVVAVESEVKREVSSASPDHLHHCHHRTEGREGAVLLNSVDQSDSRCHNNI